MHEKEFIEKLWRTGHFWNAAYSELLMVRQSDLSSLTLQDRVVQLAVKSFQEADANLVPLVQVFHGRAPVIDGLAGPATMALADVPRCPMPDHAPPPDASFDFGDQNLNLAVRTMQAWAEATGNGSWPVPGCDPNHRETHSIRVYIDAAAAPAKIKAYLAEALRHVSAAYADIGLAVRYVDGGKAEIEKRFERLPGSVIGWNEFPQVGTCNQTVNGRLDIDFQPEMNLWANLEAHETGHGVALSHTRGGIMNPSILLVWPLTWRGDVSFATLKRYFGGDPVGPPVPVPTPVPVPIPTPPPPSGRSKLLVVMEVDDRGAVPVGRVVTVTRDGLPWDT